MIRFYLIRHSRTYGNTLRRYIGVTDEPLCEEGIRLLGGKTYPKVEAVFVSPLIRCRQTADIIYPEMEKRVISDLSECDFGDFENKSAEEMNGDPDFQAWVDSGAALPFPHGETREGFILRSVQGFAKVVDVCKKEQIREAALVVHGGTIMSIMSTCAVPVEDYYFFRAENGEGYVLDWDEEKENDIEAVGGVDIMGRCGRVFDRLSAGRSKVDVPSGETGGKTDFPGGKNYEKLFS